MANLPSLEPILRSPDLEKKRGRGRRELALNLPDAGELVVSNASEFLDKTLAANAVAENRVMRGRETTECCLAFLFFSIWYW
jgi:hypothetical protein